MVSEVVSRITSSTERRNNQLGSEQTVGYNVDDDGMKPRLEASKVREGPPTGAVDQDKDGVIIGSHRDQSGTCLGQHPPPPPLHPHRRRVVSFPYTTKSRSSDQVQYQQQVVSRDGELTIQWSIILYLD